MISLCFFPSGLLWSLELTRQMKLSVLLLMIAWQSILWITGVSQNTCSCQYVSGCSQYPSSGQCQQAYYRELSTQYAYSQYTTSTYREGYGCSWGWWRTCYREKHRKVSKTVYGTSYYSVPVCYVVCCRGYIKTGTYCTPICARDCSNGGTCTAPDVCRCTPGWTGSICETAICNPPCLNGGTCSSPGVCSCTYKWQGSVCQTPVCQPKCENDGLCTSPGVCLCSTNWSGLRCSDPLCHPACSNGGKCMPGNMCACSPGWTGQTCETDVDECTSANPCEHYCTNMLGSFECSCKMGYKLSHDQRNCTDINECAEETHNCSHICTNTIGSFECSCLSGYRFQMGSNLQCVDIDECEDNPCQHKCMNTDGSFECMCKEGYQLRGISDCIDINECIYNDPCDQKCMNTEGSYRCSCSGGFILAGKHNCKDVDECLNGGHTCQQNCDNTVGSFSCYCNSGFVLATNGRNCEEFQLQLDTPTLPTNVAFLQTIRNELMKCAPGAICNCIYQTFRTLVRRGFSQGNVQRVGTSIVMLLPEVKPHALSDLILSIFGSKSTILLPFKANLYSLGYNCTNHQLTAETFESAGEMKIFPKIMTLFMLQLRVSIHSVVSNPKLQSLKVSGTFHFGSLSVNTLVEMSNPDIWTFEAKLGDEEINIIELISSALAIEIPSEPFGRILLVTDVSLRGYLRFSNNPEFILLLEGTLHISDWFEETFCIIINQTMSNLGRVPPQFAFVTGCTNYIVTGTKPIQTLKNLISNIAGTDLSSIPFVENLKLPKLSVIFFSSDFSISPASLAQLKLVLPSMNLKILDTGGFSFVFDFSDSGIGRSYQWIIRKNNSRFIFSPISMEGGGFSIGEVISMLSNVVQLPSLELVADDLSGILLSRMEVDIDQKTFLLSINVPGQAGIFLDSFKIGDLSVELHLNFNHQSRPLEKVLIRGILQIGGEAFHVLINFIDGLYELEACANKFDGGLHRVASSLRSRLSDPLAVSVLGLSSIGLHSPCFATRFRIGEVPRYLCFSADLFRFEFANVGISACVAQDKSWIFGFELRDFIMAKVLTSIIGSTGRQIALFNQKLDTVIVVSPISVDNVPLKSTLLQEFKVGTIVKGTTIIARSSWPESCSTDPFCFIARGLLGEGASFYLIVHIVEQYVSVDAKVNDFNLGAFTLASAAIQMRFSPTEFSLGIAAAMDLYSPPVTLIGAIRLKFPSGSVVLEMSMVGCWEDAFGLPILDLCDFFVSVTLVPGSPLPGIAFGATAKIGKEPCYVFVIKAYFSVNPGDPQDNFFYLDMGPLTLQKILDLFCVHLQLPGFLGDTGFPEGLTVSFASKMHVLHEIGLVIPAGFFFKGTINIFGLEVESELILNPPTLIDIYARLKPLNLAGGLLKVYESRANPNNGPYLHVIAGTNPPRFSASASGYVSILRIQQETIVSISDKGFQVKIFGDIFGLLQAELEVQASYGNILKADFSVAGKLVINLLKKIQDGVVGVIKQAADHADRLITSAQRKIREAEVVFDTAVAGLRRAAGEVSRARGKVSSIRSEIGHLRSKLCRFRTCPRWCVPFLCPCGCAKRVWGACVWPCLKWKSCCFTIPDIFCVLYNVGCAILRALAEIVILAVQALLFIAEGILAVIEGVLHGLTFIVDNARYLLDVVIAVLEVIKITIKVGLAALEAITKFLLTGIIDLREIGFNLRLGLFTHGEISVNVVASFFRLPEVKLQLTLPIPNPLAIVTDLAEMAIPGLGRKKRATKSIYKVLWLAANFRVTGTIYPQV